MFDSQKIDAYFEGGKPFENKKTDDCAPMSKRVRFIKLFFPCLAALLLGIMVIIPNVRKSVDLSDNITVPRKDELEKLHMESTVFYITDHKNRVNKITADKIDETEPASHKVKIIHPRGDMPTDSGQIHVQSEWGFYQQDDNVLELQQQVTAVIDETTTVTTNSAFYEFNHDRGYGKEAVHAEGDWGTLEAEAFSYDRKQKILTLYGNSRINSQNGNLSAMERTEVYQNESKIIAYGKATIAQNGTTLRADKIVGYFSDDNTHELQRAETYGNVQIKTATETAYGVEGYYEAKSGKAELFGYPRNSKNKVGRIEIHQDKNILYAGRMEIYLSGDKPKEIKQAYAYGGVNIKTPKGTAKGDWGVYNPVKNTVELFDNVMIEQDGNFIKGTHAETDLKTSVSRIRADKTSDGRISGKFYRKKGK